MTGKEAKCEVTVGEHRVACEGRRIRMIGMIGID
jgi:hypothetical protein